MFSEKNLKKAMPSKTFKLFLEISKLKDMQRWTLVGGTALAMHYNHRLSEDLDFFSDKSSLRQDKAYIDILKKELQNKGFVVFDTIEENNQIDLEIDNVKVTFFASGLKNLRENSKTYNNINVADIETLVAMKMNAIIKYRIKTRDFYDIYTIAQQENYTLSDMLCIYNKHNKNGLTDNIISNRLLKVKLDINDEGLSGMKAKKPNTLMELRKWCKKEIEREHEKDLIILNQIEQNYNLIDVYKERKFGLNRLSLLQVFASLSKDDMVIECLKHSEFDIIYTDTTQRNILDFFIKNDEIFKLLLKYTKEISDEWFNRKLYESEKKLDFIKIENSVINAIKNKSTPERLRLNANKLNVHIDDYLEHIVFKRKILLGLDTKSNDILKIDYQDNLSYKEALVKMPYIEEDSSEPIIKENEKGIYIQVKDKKSDKELFEAIYNKTNSNYDYGISKYVNSYKGIECVENIIGDIISELDYFNKNNSKDPLKTIIGKILKHVEFDSDILQKFEKDYITNNQKIDKPKNENNRVKQIKTSNEVDNSFKPKR